MDRKQLIWKGSGELQGKEMDRVRSKHLQLLFLTLLIGATPSTVHAHGIEQQVFPYAVVSGFIIGLMAATICTLRHISIWKALLPSFGIYLVILPLGSFLIIGEKVLWSEVGFLVVFVIFFGILFGLIPLTLGIVGMSFILNIIVKIIKSLRKTRTP